MEFFLVRENIICLLKARLEKQCHLCKKILRQGLYFYLRIESGQERYYCNVCAINTFSVPHYPLITFDDGFSNSKVEILDPWTEKENNLFTCFQKQFSMEFNDFLARVRELLETTPDLVHARDINGHTPLIWLIKDPAMVKLCMEYGADVNCADADGYTPLHFAVMYKNVSVTEILINHGADVKARDNQGKTPLHLLFPSSLENSSKLLTILLENGSDPQAQDYRMKKPLDNIKMMPEKYQTAILSIVREAIEKKGRSDGF